MLSFSEDVAVARRRINIAQIVQWKNGCYRTVGRIRPSHADSAPYTRVGTVPALWRGQEEPERVGPPNSREQIDP